MHANSTTSPVTALAGHMNNSAVYMLLSHISPSLFPSEMPSLKKVWQSIQTSAIPAALVANITFNTLYKHAILAQVDMERRDMKGYFGRFAATI